MLCHRKIHQGLKDMESKAAEPRERVLLESLITIDLMRKMANVERGRNIGLELVRYSQADLRHRRRPTSL